MEQVNFHLQIGESVIVQKPTQTTPRAFRNALAKVLKEFRDRHKDHQFKVVHEHAYSEVIRIAKKVDARKYDLNYYIGVARKQTIFRNLPYPMAKQKYEAYKKNPNYKTGILQIDPSI